MSGELAGVLRERVTLLRRDAARDALGGASGEWAAIGEAWAAIVPDGAGGAVSGDAPDAPQRWRVTLRAPTPATIGDRLGWGARGLRVRGRSDDPAMPDRVTLLVEEVR